jgi:hypothetical protein
MKTTLITLAFLTFTFSSFCQSDTCLCEDDLAAPVAGEFQDLVFVDCGEPNLESHFPNFTDNCDSDLEITSVVNTSTAETTVLESLNSFGNLEVNWSLLIFDLDEVDLQFFELDSASIDYDEENNSAHVYGRTISTSDPSAILDFDVHLIEASSWDEWSNLDRPTSYRDDSGLGADHYEDWTYYLIGSNSTLTGQGSLEGTLLTMAHAPSSDYFGYQEGFAAHGFSAQNGSGGWFYCSGDLEYENEVSQIIAAGDLVFNYQTCTQTTYDVQITATDDCGNSTLVTQQFKTDLSSFDPENCACQIQGCTNPEASNYNPEASVQQGTCVGCLGDFDENGNRDTADLLTFIGFYGCEADCEGDLNQDGNVITSDLLIFLSNFGKNCNPD